jgi:hypothetical protein
MANSPMIVNFHGHIYHLPLIGHETKDIKHAKGLANTDRWGGRHELSLIREFIYLLAMLLENPSTEMAGLLSLLASIDICRYNRSFIFSSLKTHYCAVVVRHCACPEHRKLPRHPRRHQTTNETIG